MQGAQIQAADWLAPYSDEPEKVREFCVRQGILDEVRTAVELTQRSFPPLERLTLSLWKDPLEGTEKVKIDVVVRSSLEEARGGYDRYVRAWVEVMPFPKGERIFFSYTIV